MKRKLKKFFITKVLPILVYILVMLMFMGVIITVIDKTIGAIVKVVRGAVESVKGAFSSICNWFSSLFGSDEKETTKLTEAIEKKLKEIRRFKIFRFEQRRN